MSNVAILLEDLQFANDEGCSYSCLHRCLKDEYKKYGIQNRLSAAQAPKYEFKNPSWISLLKEKILSS